MATILVIEDEQTVRESIVDVLGLEGFQVLEAANGRSGLDLAQQHLPDLVLCDVQMPDMTGYEVLTQLHHTPTTATIPFVFLTARSTKADIRQGMELGADDYLTKPCSADELLRAIATRLDKHSVIQSHTQQQLDALRSSIALSIPHELRTPITSILSSVELLRLYATSGDSFKLLEIADGIQSSTNRLYQLIQRFLLYTQLELGSRDPSRLERFRCLLLDYPTHFIESVAIRVAEQSERRKDLVLQVEGGAIAISEVYLRHLLEELIDNAFKFSNPGTPVQVRSVAGTYWTLEISNQGRGMTAEQIASIGAYFQFERKFYEQQGVGLGLVIARLLAELHEGSLEIRSIPEVTTTVRVQLPGYQTAIQED